MMSYDQEVSISLTYLARACVDLGKLIVSISLCFEYGLDQTGMIGA